MKFDDGEYYFLNTENEDFTWEAAITHMGMYVAWLIGNGLLSNSANASEVQRVKSRAITGAQFVEEQCDCKLLDEDLGEEGLAFTTWYYEARYMREYCRHFNIDGSVDSLAKVANTWDNYDSLAPLLDGAFTTWRREACPNSASRIYLWRHPTLWTWPTKYPFAEQMLEALQSQRSNDRRTLTKLVDDFAVIDMSHDWSQLEKSATAVSEMRLKSADAQLRDKLEKAARKRGYSLFLPELGAFYFANGTKIFHDDSHPKFRDYMSSGEGAKKSSGGIASMEQLIDTVCARWAPTLARFGFSLDSQFKDKSEKYTERRFVAENATTLFRVDITALDRLTNTQCPQPFELRLDLYFCFKPVAETRLKAHFPEGIPVDAKLPSTAFLTHSQWLPDPHGLKSAVEDYLVVNDAEDMLRVCDLTAAQFEARLPELLGCFANIETLERTLNSGHMEFSIFHPGNHMAGADHVVAAYLVKSPRLNELCAHFKQRCDAGNNAMKGRGGGLRAMLRDMEEAQTRHLFKCIDYVLARA